MRATMTLFNSPSEIIKRKLKSSPFHGLDGRLYVADHLGSHIATSATIALLQRSGFRASAFATRRLLMTNVFAFRETKAPISTNAVLLGESAAPSEGFWLVVARSHGWLFATRREAQAKPVRSQLASALESLLISMEVAHDLKNIARLLNGEVVGSRLLLQDGTQQA